MIRHLWYFILFISIKNFAQNLSDSTIFLDEDFKPIDQVTYFQKSYKEIYKQKTIQRDTLTIKTLDKRYEFRQLSEIDLKQVQQLLKKYLAIDNFEKNIILVYQDSILGYEHYSKSIDHLKSLDEHSLDLTNKKYLKSRKKFDVEQKKCQKFAKKNNTLPYYVYSHKIDFEYKTKFHTKKKIPSVLKSIFFNNTQRGNLILKPNGQVFFYTYLTQAQVQKMLSSDWTAYIEDFNDVKNNPNIYKLEFLKQMRVELNKLMRQKSQTAILSKRREMENNKNMNINSSSNSIIDISTPNCFTTSKY